MKMIEVYMKMTNFEIELGTKLIIGDYTFVYVKRWFSELSVSYRFEDSKEKTLEDYYDIDLNFLNKEVELIQPMKKKYLVKINIRGLRSSMSYLNYDKDNGHINISDKYEIWSAQTKFTEKEMQSIQPVKEFLEDMQGKYELVEVEDNE